MNIKKKEIFPNVNINEKKCKTQQKVIPQQNYKLYHWDGEMGAYE